MDIDISMDIHGKSVDMDMDMDGKFHIHGKLYGIRVGIRGTVRVRVRICGVYADLACNKHNYMKVTLSMSARSSPRGVKEHN